MILMSLLTVVSFQLMAQRVLNIYQKDGALVSFSFAEMPKVSFDNDKLVVNSEKTIAEFLVSDVDRFTFEDVVTSIHNDELKIANSSNLEVYTLEGKLIEKGTVIDDKTVLRLDDLPKGIYVVGDGRISYKIQRR